MTLATIPNPHDGAVKQQHTIPVPALCPVSHNPAQGSRIVIAYIGHDTLLDVTTIPPYIAEFSGSQVTRDLERFAAQVGDDVARLVGSTVTIVGEFVLTDGQLLRCELKVSHLG